jgi:predicted amidophosphoribosyltransferase
MRKRNPETSDELHCPQCGRDQPRFTYKCWSCLAPLTDRNGRYLPEAVKEVQLELTGCAYCEATDCLGCYPE